MRKRLQASPMGKIFALLSEEDLQACKAPLQASPRRRWVAFSKENDGRSLQSEIRGYYQEGNSLKAPFLYVLSFLKRKYERKQFEGHIPSKTPLKSSRRELSAPSALSL